MLFSLAVKAVPNCVSAMGLLLLVFCFQFLMSSDTYGYYDFAVF